MALPWESTHRKTKSVVLALALLHWRTKRAYSGATYQHLFHVLGTTRYQPLHRQLQAAESDGFVAVRRAKHWPRRAVVVLTKHALREIDRLFKTALEE